MILKMTGCHDATKDLVQEIFMKLWMKRENLAAVENVSSYLFTIVYRQVYHHFRKLALEKKLVDRLPVLEPVDTTSETVLLRELKKRISHAVGQLPPQQKAVFSLVREEGLSRTEIADQLKISPNTVKNHLATALKSIRSALEETSIVFSFFLFFL